MKGFDNFFRQDRRTITGLIVQLLGVGRLVAMHPADDRILIQMAQRGAVLFANQMDPSCFQLGQLLLRWPAPEPNKSIESSRSITLRVARALQPYRQGEEGGIGG